MVGEKLEKMERKMKFMGRVLNFFLCCFGFDLVVVIVFVQIFEL